MVNAEGIGPQAVQSHTNASTEAAEQEVQEQQGGGDEEETDDELMQRVMAGLRPRGGENE